MFNVLGSPFSRTEIVNDKMIGAQAYLWFPEPIVYDFSTKEIKSMNEEKLLEFLLGYDGLQIIDFTTSLTNEIASFIYSRKDENSEEVYGLVYIKFDGEVIVDFELPNRPLRIVKK